MKWLAAALLTLAGVALIAGYDALTVQYCVAAALVVALLDVAAAVRRG